MKSTSIKIKNTEVNKNKGFTLFVALVVSSMLLSIGLSLGNIILKQLIFSSSGKESQLAFYAADSGAECALYWDRKDASGVTTFNGVFASSTLNEDLNIRCGMGMTGEESVPSGLVGGLEREISFDGFAATTTFNVDFRDPNNSALHEACARVTVSKRYDDPDGDGELNEHTVIDSRGYNAEFLGTVGSDPASTGDCQTTGTRVVERAILLEY